MDLDTLVRSATRELLEQPAPDVEARYAALRRTRSRRGFARVVVAAGAVIAVGLGTWQMMGPEKQRPEPAPPPAEVTNGTLLAASLTANPHAFTWSPALGDPIGALAEGLPEDIAKHSYLQFTSDGSDVIYQDDADHMVALDLTTGASSELVTCLVPSCKGVLSPDGTTMAYGTADGVLLQDVRTGEAVRRLVPDLGRVAPPAWSPDGTRLAFERVGVGGIYTVNADGSDQRLIRELARPTSAVAWSPDGSRVAFFDTTKTSDDGSGDTRFTAMTVNRDGSRPVTLLYAGHCTCGGLFPPSLAWSPDGELIAIATTQRRGGAALYTVRPDGSDPQAVRAGYYGPLAWQPVLR